MRMRRSISHLHFPEVSRFLYPREVLFKNSGNSKDIVQLLYVVLIVMLVAFVHSVYSSLDPSPDWFSLSNACVCLPESCCICVCHNFDAFLWLLDYVMSSYYHYVCACYSPVN